MLVSEILDFKNFRTKKLQMFITFDREFGLGHSKNESCLKWVNETVGQPPKAVGPLEISKFHCLGFLFYFFVIFHPFL